MLLSRRWILFFLGSLALILEFQNCSPAFLSAGTSPSTEITSSAAPAGSLKNGEVCASSTECLSGYCYPGPENKNYCLAANLNCAQPGTDGVEFYSGYDYDGQSYYCAPTGLTQALSIKAFGAVGDGVHDDTTSVQAALDHSTDAIYFPSGTYNVTQTLQATRGSITLVGNTDSVLYWRSTAGDLFRIEGPQFQVYGLQLHGSSAFPTDSECTIGIGSFALRAGTSSEASFGTLDHVTIEHFNDGVKLDSHAQSWTLKNSKFIELVGICNGYGYGILMGGSSGNLIDSNSFQGQPNYGRHAIYISDGSSSNQVRNNRIDAFNSSSIALSAYPNQPANTGNQILANVISNQMFSFNGQAAIELYGDDVNTLVKDNRISNCSGPWTVQTQIPNTAVQPSGTIYSGNTLDGQPAPP